MINKDVYGDLKNQYGLTSSWTVWSKPANENWKSKELISDMTPFSNEECLLKDLNGDYIFVGLNPAAHDAETNDMAWRNFHSKDVKRSQDYKLRYALKDTPYWGSFITDLCTDIVETDSRRVLDETGEEQYKVAVNRIVEIREVLGGKATVVAVGWASYKKLKKYLPVEIELKRITHFSARVNLDKYCDSVRQQLEP